MTSVLGSGETCFKYLQIMEPVPGSQDVSNNNHAGILENPSVHTRMITNVSMYYIFVQATTTALFPRFRALNTCRKNIIATFVTQDKETK